MAERRCRASRNKESAWFLCDDCNGGWRKGADNPSSTINLSWGIFANIELIERRKLRREVRFGIDVVCTRSDIESDGSSFDSSHKRM
ncbi:hypothetical protein DACRYDRAFT_25482, partial [Dacryopinax primogenitus]